MNETKAPYPTGQPTQPKSGPYTLDQLQAALDRLRESYWVNRQLDENYNFQDVAFDQFVSDLVSELEKGRAGVG